MSEAPTAVELDGLEVRLGGRPVLKGLTASLSGRAIGLLGPNGAGKTTLLHTLLGFFPPSGGSARIFGRDVVRETSAVRSLLGYMPESDTFVADISGVRMVRLMAELSGLPPAAALERAHEALYYVGMGEARYRKVGSYSTGMKQTVKLAQALVHGPRLLLLDEPTNGLDPPARERMLKLVRDIRDSGEVTVVLSSHLLRDIEQCCDEALVLKNGRIAVYCDLEAERRTNRSFVELEIRGTNGHPGALGDFLGAAEALGCEVAMADRNRGAAAASEEVAEMLPPDPTIDVAVPVAPAGAAGAVPGAPPAEGVPGPRGRRVKMVMPEGVGSGDLYRLAAEREVQIRRLTRKRDSLQDIFLQAMEAPEPADVETSGAPARGGR